MLDNVMRKAGYVVLFLALFLVFVLTFHMIGSSFFPVDPETDTLLAPGWYSLVLILGSGIADFVIVNLLSAHGMAKRSRRLLGYKFKIPRTRAARNTLALNLAHEYADAMGSIANSTTIENFNKNYAQATISAKKIFLMANMQTSVPGNYKTAYLQLEQSYQQYICSAVDRSGEFIISNCRSRIYTISGEEIDSAVAKFKDCIDNEVIGPDRADANSIKFANEKFDYVVQKCDTLKDVAAALKQAAEEREKKQQERLEQERRELTQIEAALHKVDTMEGHDFEYYCAELLEYNGFTNVEVTRGSGDQGVDILAEKDGVQYAVQCKCYSKDLGNTPIQEVYTGKNIYHRQIGAVLTNRYFTQGAKDAAKATGVLLWDRDHLTNLIKHHNDQVFSKCFGPCVDNSATR